LYSDTPDDTMFVCLCRDARKIHGYVYASQSLDRSLGRRIVVLCSTYALRGPLEHVLSKMNHVLDLVAGRVSKNAAIVMYKAWETLIFCTLPCITIWILRDTLDHYAILEP
jgi:hypothetical protein